MAKFCTSCGMKLADDAVFCKNCGKKQVNFQDVSKFKTVKTNTTSQSDAIKEKLIDKTPKVMNCGAVTKKSMEKNNSNVKTIVFVIIVLVGVFGGICQYFGDSSVDEAGSVKIESPSIIDDENTKEIKLNKNNEMTKQNDATLTKMKAVLESYNIADEVLATSYGHSNAGSLSIIQTDNGKKHLLAIDNVNQRVAIINFTPAVYDFLKQVYNTGKVLLPIMVINDQHDKDAAYGTWVGNDHKMDILAAFSIDAKQNVVPGMLTSGKGAHPAAYQDVLYETKNVNMVNLILTEMKALHEDMQKRGIKIDV